MMENDDIKNDFIRKSSIEEELSKKRRLIYINVGDSMNPFIKQGWDLLVIERPLEWENLSKDSKTMVLVFSCAGRNSVS